MGELMHSGVAHNANPPGRGSGRYPFGSGKRPFQGLPRSLAKRLKNNKRKSVSLIKKLYQKHKDKKLAKEQAEKEAARKKYEDYVNDIKSRKEEILKKGDAAQILELHQVDPLTANEMNTALNRMEAEDKLRNFVPKKKTKLDKFYKLMDNVDTGVKNVTKYTKTGIEAYNTLAKIYNSTIKEKDEKPWPIIRDKDN